MDVTERSEEAKPAERVTHLEQTATLPPSTDPRGRVALDDTVARQLAEPDDGDETQTTARTEPSALHDTAALPASAATHPPTSSAASPEPRGGSTARASSSAARGMLIGRYLVISQLGAGAMGVVFAAFDAELDRKVALKLLKHRRGDVTTDRKRLQREAQSLAKLDHPNVVSVFDVGVHEDRTFVAMEFVEGQTLGDWMEAVDRPRPWPEILEVFMAAGRGLSAAHETGLIHRDFKPDNVMLGADGRVRVMDFGLARGDEGEQADELSISDMRAPVGKLTQTGTMMGTPAYMSFEQFEAGKVDARSDQFGFCVALYEALYGERPFPGETISELLRALQRDQVRPAPQGVRVPSWLREVVVRGLAKDPEARFASMDALLAALADDPIAKRQRFMLWGGICLVLVSGAWGIATLWGQVSEQKRLVAEKQQNLEAANVELRAQSDELRAQKDAAEASRRLAEDARALAEQAKTQAENSQKENERSVRQMFAVALRPVTEALVERRAAPGVVEVDERWTPLLERGGQAIVAASMGADFRVVVGDASVLGDTGDGRSLFLEITTQWLLADQGQRRVAIVGQQADSPRVEVLERNLMALDYACELDPSLAKLADLDAVGMLILDNRQRQDFAAEEIQTIAAFVERGGGLLALGAGPTWTADDAKLDDYPMNRALASFGVRWLDATVAPELLEQGEDAVVVFENKLDVEVNLYTRSAEREDYYTTLAPGERRELLTALGREWVFRKTASGVEIDVAVVEEREQVLTIGDTVAKTRPKPRPAPAPTPTPETQPKPGAKLPEALSSEDMQAGLSAARKAALACGAKLKTVQSQATVKLLVGPDGKVESATVLPPIKGTKEATCIEDELVKLRFARTRGGGEATWKLELY